MLFPLIVAHVTRQTGHYTTSLGVVGRAIGGGATLSTTLTGLVADHLGDGAAFLSLTTVGICATVIVWTFMPETRVAVPGGAGSASGGSERPRGHSWYPTG